jgi:uncharacterized protein (DUF2345 family)
MSESVRIRNDSPLINLDNPGPYLARVINNIDPMRQGGLEVELLQPQGNQDSANRQLFVVKYLSPFYGVTDVNVNGSDPADFNQTQKSYGFWFVPPDTGSLVMVIFVNGSPSQGYWMGCVQDVYMNYMIPGNAASKSAADQTRENNDAEWKESTKSTKELYGTDFVPTGEFNRRSLSDGTTTLNPEIDAMKKPVHPFAQVLADQGTITDTVRGTHTSSARRETPSNVFGISTPGPVDKRTNAQKGRIGRIDNQVNKFVSRLGGHSIIMDDGNDRKLRKYKPSEGPPEYADVEAGDTGGLVEYPHDESFRIRTRTGHQILLHNTEDLIYITNASGSAWIELTSQGKIDIYASDSISIRTETDFNFVADRDINLSAGRSINLHSSSRTNINANDTVNIRSDSTVYLNADSNLHLKATGKLMLSGDTNIEIKTQTFKLGSTTTDILTSGAIHITANGNLEFKGANTLISSNSTLDILSGVATNITSSDLNVNSAGNILLTSNSTQMNSSGGIVAQGAKIDLNASGNITAKGSQIHLNGPSPATAAVAGFANQASEATAAAGAESAPKLVLFPLPGLGQLIVKRAPTQEPWDHHENTNPAGFTYDLTDRESSQMPYTKDGPRIEIRSTEDNEKVPSEQGGNAGYNGQSNEGVAGGGVGNSRRQTKLPPDSSNSTTETINEAQLAKMPSEWTKDQDFLSAVQALAKKMGSKPIELLALMMFESASSMSPSITNSLGYTGLIQFGNSACTTLSKYYKTTITTSMLRQMSRAQQMEWVDKYFSYWMKIKNVKPPMTLAQMYILVALPGYVNSPPDATLAAPDGPNANIWRANPGWRIGGGRSNGVITRESIGNAPRAMIPRVQALLDRNGVKFE